MPVLSVQQAITYALAAGFSDPTTIVEIARAESGLDTLATNTAGNSAGTDRGILQINSYYHPEVSDAQAFDPAQAFVAGYQISRQGTNYTPWSTYKSGAYRSFPVTYRILPNALHFSEFQGGYHGTCGETALATAMVCSTPPIEDTQEAIDLMLSMTHEMISLGWASSSGSTTTARLRDEATRRGFTYDTGSFISFSQPLPNATTFHNLLLSVAGVKPIIIEIANAGVLEGNSVQYHFICVVGITDAGYICNDGDNPTITSHLVTYSWAQIEAAIPCGVLVLDMKEGSPMPVPSGWSDDGTTLKSPNGVPAVHAIRQYILDHAWDAKDYLLAPEEDVAQVELFNTAHGAGAIQYSTYSQVSWTAKEGAFRTYLGNEASFMRDRISALQQQASSKDAEISSLESQIAALNAQIAALKSQPPASAPIDPSVKTALSAALQLVQPSATVASDLQAALKTLP